MHMLLEIGGVCAEGMRRIYICGKNAVFVNLREGMRRGYAPANLWFKKISCDLSKCLSAFKSFLCFVSFSLNLRRKVCTGVNKLCARV